MCVGLRRAARAAKCRLDNAVSGTSKILLKNTTADEDEASEGNPGNSNGDAVDVPPVGMAEPGPRGRVVPSELSSAILQHGPCRLNGTLAISSENGNRPIFSEKQYLHISQSCWLFGGHR